MLVSNLVRWGAVVLRSTISAIVVALLLPAMAGAGVVELEVTSRDTAAGWSDDTDSGSYEIIKGVIRLEVDPGDPVNQRVVDLNLAPRNEQGYVEFSTEFELHKPVDVGRGNHRLLYFVNNRGRKSGAGHFSYGADRNWLYDKGWSYLWCGWNGDVEESDRKLNIRLPVATEGGEPITGKAYAEMVSYANDPVPSMPFTWGGSVPYPTASLDNSTATLTMCEYRWDDPTEISRDGWSFARFDGGRAVPDSQHLYIEDGFRPGWLYDLVYVARSPRVTGLGMAAIRDVVSFFRYESADEEGTPNPLAGSVERVYGWGHSQSARLLNHFVHQDFNGDEEGRIVFDGIQANCPGAGKGQFNSRFAQTTRHGSHHEDNLYPVDSFPLATVEQLDSATGERGDNLELARRSGFLPRMFYINSSTDYWTRAASLLHTDVAGERDIAIDPSVRIYAVAGRAHVDGRIGIVARALLTALDEWVSDGTEPPPSQVPKIANGTLTDLSGVREVLPAIPGMRSPDSFYSPYRLDPGPRWEAEGIADNVPPKTGSRYVCLVPQVDEDGNEIAGIRLPEIAVPLATFCGWKMRPPTFSNTLGRNTGQVWPFAVTAGDCEASGDPRRSVSERYPDPTEFVSEVRASLQELQRMRLLLREDADRMLGQAEVMSGLLNDLRPPEEVAATDGAEAAADYFNRLIEADAFSWLGGSVNRVFNSVNAKGYELMAAGSMDSAKEVFELNTLMFPDSWIVWDSLAECELNMKHYDESRRLYERSLELNPENINAVNMLQEIRRMELSPAVTAP